MAFFMVLFKLYNIKFIYSCFYVDGIGGMKRIFVKLLWECKIKLEENYMVILKCRLCKK